MRRDLERDPAGEELERLLAARGNWLMAAAIALTSDRADAEDLLQAALERLLRHRRGTITDTEAYLRRTQAQPGRADVLVQHPGDTLKRPECCLPGGSSEATARAGPSPQRRSGAGTRLPCAGGHQEEAFGADVPGRRRGSAARQPLAGCQSSLADDSRRWLAWEAIRVREGAAALHGGPSPPVKGKPRA
jgi:hypothetical protein